MVVPEARQIAVREARGVRGLAPGPAESRRREAAARCGVRHGGVSSRSQA